MRKGRGSVPGGESWAQRARKDFLRNKWVYVIALVCLAYYFIFCYAPMFGVVVAFKDFRPARGVWGSKWVGLKWFKEFLNSYYFGRLLRNTLVLNLLSLCIGYTLPIVFALLINELRNERFKRMVQTISYLPHFISIVVACGIVLDMLSYDGLLNQMLAMLGVEPKLWMTTPKYFPWIHEFSGVWQEMGYSSIIYLAALSAVDMQLMDAAAIDGCNRFKRVIHVSLPSILPTIIMVMLMKIGRMMTVGYEKIILLYNESIYETADVMSSFVYRVGMLDGKYSYSAAVNMFNSVINVFLLVLFNYISRKTSEISLW